MQETAANSTVVDLTSRFQIGRRGTSGIATPIRRKTAARAEVIEAVTDWLLRAETVAEGAGISGSYHLQSGWASPSLPVSAMAISSLLGLPQSLNSRFHDIGRRLGKNLIDCFRANENSLERQTDAALVAITSGTISSAAALVGQAPGDQTVLAMLHAGTLLAEKCREHDHADCLCLSDLARAARALLQLPLPALDGQLCASAFDCGEKVCRRIADDGYPRGSRDRAITGPALIEISHTLYHLWTAGKTANENHWCDAAARGAEKLLQLYAKNRMLAGRYGPDWHGDHSFSCLAGCAQTALLWLNLYQHTKSREYLHAAQRLNRFIAATIDIHNPDPGIRGGVRAGYPLWVNYHPLTYQTEAAILALNSFLTEKQATEVDMPIRKLRLVRPAPSRHI